jgi:hypothetical protein
MAWYLRKAFRLGPLMRLNVSKSGLGVSFGVRGLRLGTGPRGSYFHAGRGGLYYRQSLSHSRGVSRSPAVDAPEFAPIDSTDIDQLTSADTEDAITAYNEVLARPALTPWILFIAAACGVAFFGTDASVSLIWIGIGTVLAVLVGITVRRDRVRLHYVVDYDLSPHQARAYEELGHAFDRVAGCGRVWHVAAEGSTGDRRKYHAGAGSVVRRTVIEPTRGLPRRLRSELTFPTLRAGSQTLYFLPDCLLVLEGRRAGALGYHEVRGQSGTTRFIESDTLSPDARVVGETWQYVNKDGRPDRRFANNRQLAICEYGTLRLGSASGLTEEFQASLPDVFPAFTEAIREMARSSPVDRSAESVEGAPASRSVHFKTREDYEAWKADRQQQQTGGTGARGGWAGDKVPRSRLELEEVRTKRPGGWEYLYFAGLLLVELEESKDKYLDHERKYAPPVGEQIKSHDAPSFLSDSLNKAGALVQSLTSMMTPEVQQHAFGPPGVPGDAEQIRQLAERWNSVYVGFLDWSARVRGARRSEDFDHAFEILAGILDRPIEEYRRFVNRFVTQADRIPAAVASKDPLKLELTLTLTIDDSLVDAFGAELRRVARGTTSSP